MLTFFKINHKHCLEWGDLPDPLTFIIVVKVVATSDLGFSTYILTNQKKDVAKRYTSDGHSTVKITSQFDVALETGLMGLSADMPVIGVDALEQFIVRDKSPFFHSGLREVLTGNRNIHSGDLSPVTSSL